VAVLFVLCIFWITAFIAPVMTGVRKLSCSQHNGMFDR